MQDTITITAISRGEMYSPNHTNNDSMIFQQTIDELRLMGALIEVMDEDTFLKTGIKNNIVLTMARNSGSVNKLVDMEEKGVLVINSGRAINNCYRANLTRLLLKNNISYPESIVVTTNDLVWEELKVFNNYPLWIKRGDVHAIHKEDVVLVYCLEEANNVLNEFQKRGIHQAVIMEHVEGDIIKFYGVRETGFFYWFNLLDTRHTKFNIEKDVNNNNHTFFNIDELKELAETSASLAGIYIYGGDAIVRPDGRLCLIDLNDWPSFAPVRDEASLNIAKLIYNKSVKFMESNIKSYVSQQQI